MNLLFQKLQLYYLKAKLSFLKAYYRIRNKIIMIGNWFQNMYFVFATNKSECRVFSGYAYRWLAIKYAEKRSEISKANKLCGGKRHYVIEYDKDSLIVINKTEINRLKTKHRISKSYNIFKALETAFYITQ